MPSFESVFRLRVLEQVSLDLCISSVSLSTALPSMSATLGNSTPTSCPLNREVGCSGTSRAGRLIRHFPTSPRCTLGVFAWCVHRHRSGLLLLPGGMAANARQSHDAWRASVSVAKSCRRDVRNTELVSRPTRAPWRIPPASEPNNGVEATRRQRPLNVVEAVPGSLAPAWELDEPPVSGGNCAARVRAASARPEPRPLRSPDAPSNMRSRCSAVAAPALLML